MDQAEARYVLEPADNLAPDVLFDRTWASTVMATALKELEKGYAEEGKQEFFSHLQVYMSGNDADGHVRLAKELDMNPNTLRVAVHRMRKRFRKILERTISETVDGSDNIAGEITYLLGLFSCQ